MSQELRTKTVKDLEDLIISKKNEIVENSKNIVKGSEKNVKKNLFLRKEVARIKTILNEKKLLDTLNEGKTNE
jgi:ribosomal protein L29